MSNCKWILIYIKSKIVTKKFSNLIFEIIASLIGSDSKGAVKLLFANNPINHLLDKIK